MGPEVQDVIFAGRKQKRPWLCRVTLVFDNSDGFLNLGFDEVTVTRRLFRRESAYLEWSSMPAQDIVDLFSGTGLGKSLTSC